MDFNPYRIEPVRRNSRRCIGHDYCEPCIYMITATEHPGRPALAFVNASAVMERTALGEAVYQEIVGIHWIRRSMLGQEDGGGGRFLIGQIGKFWGENWSEWSEKAEHVGSMGLKNGA